MKSYIKRQIDQMQHEKKLADPATFLYAYLAGKIAAYQQVLRELQKD